MSEQAATLTTSAKTSSKASVLSALLKLGKTDTTTSEADFLQKLVEMMQTNGSQTAKQTGKDSSKSTNANDDAMLVAMKQLLSNAKLNDTMATAKSIKNMKDAVSGDQVSNTKNIVDLKQLLALAEDGGVNVASINIEKDVSDGTDASQKQTKSKTKQTQTKTSDDSAKTTSAVSNKTVSNDAAATGNTKQSIANVSSEQTSSTMQTNDAENARQKRMYETKTTQQTATSDMFDATATQTALQKSLKTDTQTNNATVNLARALQDDVSAKSAVQESVLTEKSQQDTKTKQTDKNTQQIKPSQFAATLDSIEQTNTDSSAKTAEIKELSQALLKEATGESDKQVDSTTSQSLDVTALTATTTDVSDATNDLKGKMALAQETLKNFSQDLKDVVDSYKPPLMKVSMELNPQNMGNVDVTLITRGQNLVVNVSSNQDTMQMFMQNLPQFKENLQNIGFTSLQMNFNFSDNSGQNGGRNWQRQEATKTYEDNDKTVGSIDSLDIVMPHPQYA